MATMTELVQGFRTLYAEAFDSSIEGVERVEEYIENTIKKLESEYRTYLVETMHAMIDGEALEVYVYFDIDNLSWAWAHYIGMETGEFQHGYSTKEYALRAGLARANQVMEESGRLREVVVTEDVASYAVEGGY